MYFDIYKIYFLILGKIYKVFLFDFFMVLKIVSTDKAPKAVGSYSQAVIDTDTNVVYLSGQVAINPETNDVSEVAGLSVEEQTKRIMQNLEAVLFSAGSDFNHVLKVRIFLTEISDFPKVNEIYGSYFTEHKPARATVGVASLPVGAKVEIECEAKVYKNI